MSEYKSEFQLDTPEFVSEFDGVDAPRRIDSAASKELATYASLADQTQDPFQTYKQVRGELDIGEYKTLNDIRVRANKAYNQSLIEAADDSLKQATPEQAKNIVSNLIAETSKDIPVKKTALENVAAQNFKETNTKKETIKADTLFELATKSHVNIDAINAAFDAGVRGEETKTGFGAFRDVVEFILPGHQLILGRVAKEFLGEHYVVAQGDMIRDLAIMIRNQPKDKQADMAKKVQQSIFKAAGVIPGTRNAVEAMFLNEMLKEYATRANIDPEGVDWSRWISNVGGALELTGILAPVAGIGKLARMYKIHRELSLRPQPNSALGKINQVAPETGAELQAAALEDKTEQLAEGLGTSHVGLVENQSPQSPILTDIKLGGSSPRVLEKIAELQAKADEISVISTNTGVYMEDTYKAKIEKLHKLFEEADDGFYYHPDKYTISRNENLNQIDYEAVLGRKAGGFDSVEEANQAIDKFISKLSPEEFKEADFQVLYRNPDTNVIERLGETTPYEWKKGTEFFVSFKGSHPMQYSDIVEGTTKSKIKAIGDTLKVHFTPRSIMDTDFFPGANASLRMEGKLKNGLADLAKPYRELSFGAKVRVTKLLEEGNDTKQVYDVVDLVSKYKFTDKEIIGYLSARTYFDTVFNLKNAYKLKDLKAQGYRGLSMTTAKGHYENAARVIRNETLGKELRDSREIWDIAKGEGIKVTDSLVDELGDRVVVELLQHINTGKQRYKYAVAPKESITTLPNQVIRKHPGYVYRLNKDPFYVKEVEDIHINGVLKKDHPSTILVARTRKEATAAVAKLKEQREFDLIKEGVEPAKAKEIANKSYHFDIDRNIDTSETKLAHDETLINNDTSYWFSRRGERLLRPDGTESKIADPSEAIERLTGSFSNVFAWSDFINAQKILNQKTFPDLWEGNVYIGNRIDKLDDDIKRGQAHMRWLDALRSTPTATDNWYTRMLIDMDRYINNALPRKLSEVSSSFFLDFAQRHRVPTAIRKLAWNTLVVMRPTRQVALNTMTSAYTAGLDPVLSAKAFKDGIVLIPMSFATRSSPKAWAATKKIAKQFGYQENEWEELFDAFKNSGTHKTVDSQLYLQDSMLSFTHSVPQNRLSSGLSMAGNALKSPFVLAKHVYIAGEIENLGITWLFAKNLWQKRNPGKVWNGSQKNLDDIADMGRAYSLDMSRLDQLPYQKGMFANLTQFWAISHKAYANHIPEKLGGTKHMTGYRGRLILGGIIIGGAAWYDVDYLTKKAMTWVEANAGVKIPDPLYKSIQEGFVFATLNAALNLAFTQQGDDEFNVAWSNDFSPMSRNPVRELAEAIISGDKTPLELVFGAGGFALPNIKAAAEDFMYVWGHKEREAPTYERVLKSGIALIDNFGLLNDVAKVKAMRGWRDKVDYFYSVTPGLAPTVRLSLEEVWLKALIGAKTTDELDYHRNIVKYVSSESKALKKEAKWVSEKIMDIMLSEPDVRVGVRKVQDVFGNYWYDDQKRGNEVMHLAKDVYFSQDPRHTELIDKVIRYHAMDSDPNAREKTVSEIMHSPFFREEDKEKILKHVNAVFDDAEQAAKRAKQR